MKFEAVIFDLDGTLVNSLEDIANSLNAVLEKHNFPTYDIHTYKQLVGKGLRNLVRDALPETQRNEQLIAACFNEMYELYQNTCTNKTKPYTGISDLLHELVVNGIKIAVLSNKADELTKKIVLTLFPDIHFEFIVGMTDEVKRKPDPQGAVQISKGLEIQPDKILFVGDTGIDMQTASNSGMHAAGVLWGFRTKEELIQNGAKYTFEHPIELLKII